MDVDMVDASELARLEECLLGIAIGTKNAYPVMENPSTRDHILQWGIGIANQCSWSHATQTKKISDLYKSKREELKEKMKTALSEIHLSVDLWTWRDEGPDDGVIVAVYAHFLDQHGEKIQCLIGLQKLTQILVDDYDGQNLASTIHRMTMDWEINDCIGTVISSNAAINDVCADHFFSLICPGSTAVDRADRRMRCVGDVLNVVGKTLLYGEGADEFEHRSDRLITTQNRDGDLELWRTRGLVGKLRNNVRHIRSLLLKKSQRPASEIDADVDSLFEVSRQELKFMLNHDTRWCATFLMIGEAIDNRARLERVLSRLNHSGGDGVRIPDADVLSAEEWSVLEDIKEVVEPFYLRAMSYQGQNNGAEDVEEDGDDHARYLHVTVTMDYLSARLREWKALYDDPASQTRSPPLPTIGPPGISPAVSRKRLNRIQRYDTAGYLRKAVFNGWDVLSEYTTKLEQSPLYLATIILHPGLGLQWLEFVWNTPDQKQRIEEAKACLSAYWSRWYAKESAAHPPLPPPQGPARPYGSAELSVYLKLAGATLRNVDPVEWWTLRRNVFPRLSKLALSALAIPPTATDCERNFCFEELAEDPEILSVPRSKAEEVVCLKNWSRNGIYTLGGISVAALNKVKAPNYEGYI